MAKLHFLPFSSVLSFAAPFVVATATVFGIADSMSTAFAEQSDVDGSRTTSRSEEAPKQTENVASRRKIMMRNGEYPPEKIGPYIVRDVEGGVSIDGLSEDVRLEDGKLVLPEQINGKQVVEIGEHAIARRSSLKDVVIPESVKTIGQRAFSGCSSLTNLFIPAGVETIEEGAFTGCAATIEVAPENLNYVSDDGVLFDKAKEIGLSK